MTKFSWSIFLLIIISTLQFFCGNIEHSFFMLYIAILLNLIGIFEYVRRIYLK